MGSANGGHRTANFEGGAEVLRQQGVDLLSVNDDGGGGEKGRCCGHVLARLLLEGNSATGGHAGLEVLARVHDVVPLVLWKKVESRRPSALAR
jgi:hypothetical protein